MYSLLEVGRLQIRLTNVVLQKRYCQWLRSLSNSTKTNTKEETSIGSTVKEQLRFSSDATRNISWLWIATKWLHCCLFNLKDRHFLMLGCFKSQEYPKTSYHSFSCLWLNLKCLKRLLKKTCFKMTPKYLSIWNLPINLKKSNVFQVAAKLSRRYGYCCIYYSTLICWKI